MKKIAFAAAAILAIGAVVVGFLWVTCRVYVPEGYMAIVTCKVGDELQPGQILAQPGQKGVQAEVLTEGRHFLNPINNDWKLVPVTTIPIGSVGVVTSKVGKELPPGDILASDALSKGVWRSVLGPGTYRLNPEGYNIKVIDAINIPIGYVGVVTSQTGERAAPGSFAQPGQKGVMESVLQPGLYYINPRAFQVDVVEVGMNQVSIIGREGSVVLTKGQVSNATSALEDLQRATIAKQQARRNEYVSQNVSSGMVSVNATPKQQATPNNARARLAKQRTSRPSTAKASAPQNYALMADSISAEAVSMPANAPLAAMSTAKSDAVAFGMNQFVQFPSSDGFSILLDMTVEFELLPENIAKCYMLYGDLPAIVSKVILPQILSISRIKGSGYKAREFIDGEGRQKFQRDMTNELIAVLQEKHILVRNAIVRHVEVPQDILEPIQAASEAKEQDLTNKTRQETAKKQANLNSELARIDQLRKEVEQETIKLVATIHAQTKKEIATIDMQTQLQVAEINLERAKLQAKITETKGNAQIQADYLVANEEALGLQRRAKVFKDSSTLADLAFVEALNPNLKIDIRHTGEGTLWTGNALPLTLPAKR